MKKSHERWNEYQKASNDYPEELYNISERLEKRIKKESRKKKFFFTTVPTVAAAMLFVILVNTSIVFARTVSDIPLLSRISEMVMYNESLKSAVENRHIQYVNLKAENDGLELKLPYVIADSHNLVLFLQLPEHLELKENEFYMLETNHLRDLSKGTFISQGYLEMSGSIESKNLDLPGDKLNQLKLEFVDDYYTLPRNVEISLSLKKYNIRGNERDLLETDLFKFQLSLDEFREPVIYPLNQEIMLDGQKVIFREMISYPTRTEINYDFPGENSKEVNLSFTLLEDGKDVSLSSYAYLTRQQESGTKKTIHITSDYFNPPENRSISINGYSVMIKDDTEITVDGETMTTEENPYGIELVDIIRENGEVTFEFNNPEDRPGSHFMSIVDGNRKILLNRGGTREDSNIHYYTVEEFEFDTLTFKLGNGPTVTLEEPILISIPVNP